MIEIVEPTEAERRCGYFTSPPRYGQAPVRLDQFDVDLKEVMYYLYLPVFMFEAEPIDGSYVRLPDNVRCCYPLISAAVLAVNDARLGPYKYCYLSARKGWATADNPLNRPGWHCDGFGTDDMNYVWWKGPGTRFAVQDFGDISDNHKVSLFQFESRAPVDKNCYHPPEGFLYEINPFVVHATPIIETPCWRQYVKISFSNHRYNLENNSHNYLFDYDWPMHGREDTRNDTDKTQRDYA